MLNHLIDLFIDSIIAYRVSFIFIDSNFYFSHLSCKILKHIVEKAFTNRRQQSDAQFRSLCICTRPFIQYFLNDVRLWGQNFFDPVEIRLLYFRLPIRPLYVWIWNYILEIGMGWSGKFFLNVAFRSFGLIDSRVIFLLMS